MTDTAPHPFTSTAGAWFWTIGALRTQREGARRGTGGSPRRCEPDVIIRCLDQLYRAGQIGPEHARVLRLWGERGVAPDPSHPADRSAAILWTEAINRLDVVLRAKRIVA